MPVKSNQATANLFGMECLSLDDRKATILSSLVEEYIRNGDAISSSAVLELSGRFRGHDPHRTCRAGTRWLVGPTAYLGRSDPYRKSFSLVRRSCQARFAARRHEKDDSGVLWCQRVGPQPIAEGHRGALSRCNQIPSNCDWSRAFRCEHSRRQPRANG